jgi:excisionase family DNA binding protein
MSRVMKISEFCQLSGLTRKTVERAIASGSFPVQSFRVGGLVLIPREPVERLLSGSAEAQPASSQSSASVPTDGAVA